MKKIFLLLALFVTAFIQQGFAQDSIGTSHLLHSYYDIKNALVAGNANTASVKATELVMILAGIDNKVISEANALSLMRDAQVISESNDIKVQRLHLATLSSNMFALAKIVKLSAQPIYYAYCSMKKAYWLSSETAVKNPYYGTAMLTCGKVIETLK